MNWFRLQLLAKVVAALFFPALHSPRTALAPRIALSPRCAAVPPAPRLWVGGLEHFLRNPEAFFSAPLRVFRETLKGFAKIAL